jgi:Ca2+-binding RTX toxin-like protein
LVGNGGRDTLTGGAGNDTLEGVGLGSTTGTFLGGTLATRGVGEVDILTGGADNDRFILGGNNEFYYIGGATAGTDLAIIGQTSTTRDFNTGDLIQVQKGLIYRVQQQGTDTFILGTNSAGSPTFLDIIGVVVGATPTEVGASLRDQTNANLTFLGSSSGVLFFN